jgi:tripartite-type tricarboxylate transporter receptor subunit TctC
MKHLRSRGLLAIALLFAPLAFAQDAWPTKPVVIIVPFAAGGVADLLPHVVGAKRSEKWKQPVIVASGARSPELPDVPTVAESALPGFQVTSWYGIVTRAGTSPAIIARVQHDMAEALTQDDVRAKLANVGLGAGRQHTGRVRGDDQGRNAQVGRHRAQGEHHRRMSITVQ